MSKLNIQKLELHSETIIIMAHSFVYFGSGMNKEMSMLSNFSRAEFDLYGIRWPSSEHAFQAILKVERCDWERFSVNGDLGNLESGFKLLGSSENKVKYWGSKKNGKLEMVGIVAKMSVRNGEKLGLKMKKQNHSFDDMSKLFLKILLKKYKSNENHRKVLLETGEKKLIEFSRSAKRECERGNIPFWTALIDKNDNKMYGKNFQGELQMAIRSYLSTN
jgi:predicted NAD-dependent protein-ADP-ribosyltransferase YbiA (DUF1768 family)